MSKLELHFRKLILQERIEQLAGELIAMSTETRGAELGQLLAAGTHLARAVEALHGGPTEQNNLETALRLSIESVRDRKACEQIGTLNVKEPDAANVRPFLKPITS